MSLRYTRQKAVRKILEEKLGLDTSFRLRTTDTQILSALVYILCNMISNSRFETRPASQIYNKAARIYTKNIGSMVVKGHDN